MSDSLALEELGTCPPGTARHEQAQRYLDLRLEGYDPGDVRLALGAAERKGTTA
jgi:hypothetical protein